jgi:predicted O-methyltransferase YrrM
MSTQWEVPPSSDTAVAMLNLINGYWIMRALHVAAELGVADLLAAGPRSCEELAAACGVDSSALYRLLRALAGAGVFVESEPGRFAQTPLSWHLRSDVPGSQRAYARTMGSKWIWRAWENMLEGVRSGQPAFELTHQMSFFEFLTRHPEEQGLFDRAMINISSLEHEALRDAYDFTRFKVLVDVGGGSGHLLAALLSGHAGLRGILLDRPPAIETARKALREAGLSERCELIAGSFFEQVPSGGDAYLLKYILHNWDDERALAILKSCRRAMAPGAKLLVIDQVIPPGNEPHYSKVLDLNMLVLLGGRERTEVELRALYQAAGFELSRVVPTRTPLAIVEGLPV